MSKPKLKIPKDKEQRIINFYREELSNDIVACAKCKSQIEHDTTQKIFSHKVGASLDTEGDTAYIEFEIEYLKSIGQYPISVGGNDLKKGLE
jgi:hypothetical protein